MSDSSEKKPVLGMAAVIENLKPLSLRAYRALDLDQVQPGKQWQPREMFDPEEIEGLAASIEREGQLDPILVVKRDETYYIVAGERRYRALKQLNRPTIEAIELDPGLSDQKIREIAIISNVQREDLDPFEEAIGYKILMEEHDHTYETLGEALGKKTTTIYDVVQIVGLPEQIREDFRHAENRVSRSMLIELAKVDEPDHQLTLWEKAKSGGITNRNQIRERRKPKRTKSPSKTTIKQRYLKDMQLVGQRAKQLADEDIDLAAEEIEAAETDLRLITGYLEAQRRKLEG